MNHDKESCKEDDGNRSEVQKKQAAMSKILRKTSFKPKLKSTSSQESARKDDGKKDNIEDKAISELLSDAKRAAVASTVEGTSAWKRKVISKETVERKLASKRFLNNTMLEVLGNNKRSKSGDKT